MQVGKSIVSKDFETSIFFRVIFIAQAEAWIKSDLESFNSSSAQQFALRLFYLHISLIQITFSTLFSFELSERPFSVVSESAADRMCNCIQMLYCHAGTRDDEVLVGSQSH